MNQALYRRYRPQTFSEVIGQEHVTEPLTQALKTGRVSHAYLFSGPRGCGKTTCARILARCLNCEKGPAPEPCGECASCQELGRGGGGSLDVVEIDAASHGGVDDTRDLREKAVFAPARDRYKVFVLDEAHMVSREGFNALLKIVEEPPPHVKFIFATTEPNKVLPTIRSRSHHYPFRLVPPGLMTSYMEQLSRSEDVEVAPGVMQMVVRAGGGSVRDTESVLDQLIGGSVDGRVTYERASSLLGFTPDQLIGQMISALARGDGASMFAVIESVVESGLEPHRFAEDLLERLRDLIVLAAAGPSARQALRGLPEDQVAILADQAAQFGLVRLTHAADSVSAGLAAMAGATSPRLHLELLAARTLMAAQAPGHQPASQPPGSAHVPDAAAATSRPPSPPSGRPGAASPPGVPGESPARRAAAGPAPAPVSGQDIDPAAGGRSQRSPAGGAPSGTPQRSAAGGAQSRRFVDWEEPAGPASARQTHPVHPAQRPPSGAATAAGQRLDGGRPPGDRRSAAPAGSGERGLRGSDTAPDQGSRRPPSRPSAGATPAPSPVPPEPIEFAPAPSQAPPRPPESAAPPEAPEFAPPESAPPTAPAESAPPSPLGPALGTGGGPERGGAGPDEARAEGPEFGAEGDQERWLQLLGQVRRHSVAAYGLLSHSARPVGAGRGRLALVFASPDLAAAFNRRFHGLVEQAAAEAFGQPIQVTATAEGEPATQDSPIHTPPVQTRPVQTTPADAPPSPPPADPPPATGAADREVSRAEGAAGRRTLSAQGHPAPTEPTEAAGGSDPWQAPPKSRTQPEETPVPATPGGSPTAGGARGASAAWAEETGDRSASGKGEDLRDEPSPDDADAGVRGLTGVPLVVEMLGGEIVEEIDEP
ncbi:MAG: DNA polymerase III subunit gamma and tau [Bifidobacteriaceae bacterium]|nr:DNA polymerase III subunit gamma and tau [Bifidobacteriaceae bacterium]